MSQAPGRYGAATAHGVVDRRTACKGLWFDLMEHEELKVDADIIDIGR